MNRQSTTRRSATTTTIEENEFEDKMYASTDSIADYKRTNHGIIHVRCEPVVDVYSVKLNTNSSETCNVYGDIKMFDMKGRNNCELYRWDETKKAEVIPPNYGYLRLQGPHDLPSMDKPFIAIDIREKGTRKSIVEGTARLIKSTDDESGCSGKDVFEQFRSVTIPGTSGGSATVDYLTLTYAVFAEVSIELHKSEDGRNKVEEEEEEEEESFEVYGAVSAHYRLYSTEEVHRIYLFDYFDESNMIDRVELGSDLALKRSVVAMPAYSSLVIELDLKDYANDNALIVKDTMSFDPDNTGWDLKLFKGSNGVDVKVFVRWSEPYKLVSALFPQEKVAIQMNPLPNPSCNFVLRPMVEVFSVFIGRRRAEDLSLYGMINCFGAGRMVNLFDRDTKNPYNMPVGTNFLQLEGPNPNKGCIPGDIFYLSVDLQDVNGRVIIKGFAYSTYGIDEQHKHWLDRRLCSVIQGANKDSFAALHYNVFSNPVTAKLKVHIFFKAASYSRDPYRIYGSLVAFHSKYAYTTDYEKRYYRSVLFECPETCPLKRQRGDFVMELSRTLVSVPTYCSLLIAVDLSCDIGLTAERLENTAEFQIGDSSKEITVKGFGIRIDVEWDAR